MHTLAAASHSVVRAVHPAVKPLTALKIRDQLTVALTIGVLLIVLATAIVGSALTRNKFREVFIAQGEQSAAHLAHQAILALTYESPDNAAEPAKAAFMLPAVSQLEIRTMHGVALLAKTPTGPITLPNDPPDIAQHIPDEPTLESETPDHWVFIAPARPSVTDSPFLVDVPQQPKTFGYVRLTVSKDTLAHIEQAILAGQLIILAVFAPIFVFVIRYLTSRLTRTIGTLSYAMKRAREGDTEIRAATVASAADIDDMATAFNTMMEALEARETEALGLLERNRKLAGHLDAIREEQTRLLAQELHDSLGGHFTMLKHGLESLLEDDDIRQPARDEITTLHRLATEAIHIAKNITAAMRPTMLDTLGLNRALKWYVEAWAQQTRVAIVLHLGDDARLSKTQATAIFRIAQEALTNVARHAKAHRVTIATTTAGDAFRLTITDDGRGMTNPTTAGSGLGVLGMSERAAYLDGTLDLYSAPNAGTTVAVRIPLPPLLPATTTTRPVS